MQLQLPIRSLVLVATATISSAWTFTGYEHVNYGGQSFILTGLPLPIPDCQNVPDNFKGLLSAFKWENVMAGNENWKCQLTLFTGSECSGDSVYTSSSDKVDKPYVGDQYNDKTTSVEVGCFVVQ